MLIQLIKKIQKSLRLLAQAFMQKLNSDRLTRFLITSLMTFIFVINCSGINLWFVSSARSEGSFQFGVSPTTTQNRQALFGYNSLFNDNPDEIFITKMKVRNYPIIIIKYLDFKLNICEYRIFFV